MGPNRAILAELAPASRSLRLAMPETWARYGDLYRSGLGAGTLDPATKHAIALAISVVKRCDGCIAHHARAAADAGASADLVAEVLAVALVMDGGPATVYAPRAWAAFEEFSNPDGVE